MVLQISCAANLITNNGSPAPLNFTCGESKQKSRISINFITIDMLLASQNENDFHYLLQGHLRCAHDANACMCIFNQCA